ncbi:MAG TPA: N-acetyltransferase, partial [Firmicutes bacterium]|nr:N-acetyltransferase [Bacillota bacterium]
MSDIVIKEVKSKKDQKQFIMLPWSLYKGDPFWVPPLISDMKATLNPAKNALLNLGPYAYFLAFRDGKPVGRLGVGADDRLNAAKNRRVGSFTLFETIGDYSVAKAL